jgi:Flp pilus assembly protein CpaB
MRRGRIFIYLALILILGLGAAYIVILKPFGGIGSSQTPSTPASQQVNIVVAGQNIPRGKLIDEGDLSTISISESGKVASEYTDINLVIGQYAKYQIDLGVPIIASMLSSSAGNLADTGSSWSALIPPGMTAITIPVSRLSAVGYGIQDGDHVNLIASMLLVDVDANYQSITPNLTAGVLSPNSNSFFVGGGMVSGGTGTNVTAQSVSGLSLSQQGRVELDPNFQYPFYIVPAEIQRPRLVTQMVLQNVLVLHIGTFPLPGESGNGSTTGAAVATPVAGAAAQTTIQKPDIITLVVTPQEAVTLTYLLNSGTTMTLTLRGPSDDVSRVDTEAATLQYLLSQYRIPVPAKLPYAMEPRLDKIVPPLLPNDIVTPAPAQ